MANVPWWTVPETAKSIFDLPAIQGMSNPYAALPSGQQYADQASQGAQSYLNKWGNIANMGKDFYADYAPSAVGSRGFSDAYNAQLNAQINPQAQLLRQFANQAALVSSPRGGTGYGPRGMPNRQSQFYQQAMDAMRGSAAERANTAYGRVRGEEATRAGLAQQGAQLTAQQEQAAQQARLQAYQLQAQVAYQRAQQQLAQQQMLLPYMGQAANQLSPWEEKMRREQAFLQSQQQLQASMDKQSAAQQLQRFYTGDSAFTHGLPLTDAGRGQQFAQRKQLEQALITMGVATPVSRSQKMNEIMGYGSGGGPAQSMPLNWASGLGTAMGRYW